MYIPYWLEGLLFALGLTSGALGLTFVFIGGIPTRDAARHRRRQVLQFWGATLVLEGILAFMYTFDGSLLYHVIVGAIAVVAVPWAAVRRTRQLLSTSADTSAAGSRADGLPK